MILLLNQLSFFSGDRLVLQQAIANSNNGNKANTTGQSASQSAEALVRSIMDPSSLMSSVMNETGVGKNGNLSSIDQHEGLTKFLTPSSRSKSENAVITSSSGSSLSTEKGRSNNSSSNATLSTMGLNTTQNASKNTIIRNIDTLFLAHQIIPPKDFIPLYDTSPYQILNGHVAAKIPCDGASKPSLEILIGRLPNLRPVEPHLIQEYSKPGYICMYNVAIDGSKNDYCYFG